MTSTSATAAALPNNRTHQQPPLAIASDRASAELKREEAEPNKTERRRPRSKLKLFNSFSCLRVSSPVGGRRGAGGDDGGREEETTSRMTRIRRRLRRHGSAAASASSSSLLARSTSKKGPSACRPTSVTDTKGDRFEEERAVDDNAPEASPTVHPAKVENTDTAAHGSDLCLATMKTFNSSVDSGGGEIRRVASVPPTSRRKTKYNNITVIADDDDDPKKLAGRRSIIKELLMQIIRCFPFPTPVPSPHASPVTQKKHDKRSSASMTGDNLMTLLGKRNSTNNANTKRRKGGANSESENAVNVGGNALRWMVEMSVDTMAVTALPLDCWLRERLKHWVQLSGHEGTIVPATDHTLWKRRAGTDFSEAAAYRRLMNDITSPFVPTYTNEIEYKGESFIEIEDLTQHFDNPAIMDVKIGTRTFLEAEVKNPVKRKDLYQKMVKLDPQEPTEEEHQEQAVTKLRYMQFRERQSSTHALGFRIEAMKLHGENLQKNFQKVKTRDQVMTTLLKFMGSRAPAVRESFVQRLKELRLKIEQSDFFKTHEVIGSSILFMYDGQLASAWMIDFAKSSPTQLDTPLSHRRLWQFGNHEDGYLTGLDNLIQILEDTKLKELSPLTP